MDTPIFESATRRAGVSLDPANSATLPGWAYTSADLFEREKEAVFFRTWQYGGAASQVAEPGAYMTAQVLDQSVMIIRGLDGVLRAFHNVCSHRAHQLLKGAVVITPSPARITPGASRPTARCAAPAGQKSCRISTPATSI